MKNERVKEMSLTDLQASSSYVEDGELCILVSRKVKEASAFAKNAEASDREPRWRIVADPETSADAAECRWGYISFALTKRR